jgi:hypothetical protein
MSEAESKLTEIQFAILDAMADDYENIEQVYLCVNRDFVKERELGLEIPLTILEVNKHLLHDVIDELADMLEEGYIKAKHSNDESVAPLGAVNPTALHHYWFGPTEKGKRAWETYRQENPRPSE